jgi:hypothetical protein
MRYLKCLLLFLLLGYSGITCSQEMKVTGTVHDTSGVTPLPDALIMATRIADSVLIGFTRSDAKGNFTLTGFEIDTLMLTIDHPRYDDKVYFLFGSTTNYEISIADIVMPSKSEELNEIIIYAYKDPIYYKGDTLVFIADSFKVDANAVVEDLLKKLPGIEVDDQGQIKSLGQEISKVLVDGDEFFGSDPTIATKNLGAKAVESVEVYETENDSRGEGEDEKIQVLDLKLKDAYKSGYFGRIGGASDLTLTPINGEIGGNPFYEGELLFNKFNGNQKISVFALTTNTPKSSFGWQDAMKFGLDNESSGSRWSSAQGSSNNSGIPETLRTGIYFSDKFGKKKKTKFKFNYSFYKTKLVAESASESKYFLRDTTYYTNDLSQDRSEQESHQLNVELNIPLDSLTKLEISSSGQFDKAANSNADNTQFIDEEDLNYLTTNVLNTSQSEGFESNSKIRLDKRFRKEKRRLELQYEMFVSNATTGGNLYSTNVFAPTVGLSDTTDQAKDNDNSGQSHYGTLTYTEPIGKKMRIELEYMLEYGLSNQDRTTNAFSGESYSIFVDSLSNIFTNTRTQNRLGFKLHYVVKKHNFYVGARARNIRIDNLNKISGAMIYQNINTILPRAMYQFKPSMSKRFNVKYETRSQQPSISDLQPVPDNSNPNNIKEGNPNLRPNYVHNASLRFSSWQAMSRKHIWISASFNYTDNGFTDSTSYDDIGRAYSKTVNVDGNFFSALYAGAGMPIYKSIIQLRPDASLSYNRFNNFINDRKNETTNLVASGGTRLMFEWDSLDIELRCRLSYNNPKSSVSSISNTPFSTQRYTAKFSWKLKYGFELASDVTYNLNNQPGDGFYDLEYVVWNAEVSKSFLKTENLVVSIIGNDILNQNISAARQVSANSITDYKTVVISRYFLLRATLRFNNNKTREEDFKGWH